MTDNIPNQNSTPPLPPSASPMDDDLDSPQSQSSPVNNLYNPSPTKPPPTPASLPTEPPPLPPASKKDPIMDISQIKSSMHKESKKRWPLVLITIIVLIIIGFFLFLLDQQGIINFGFINNSLSKIERWRSGNKTTNNDISKDDQESDLDNAISTSQKQARDAQRRTDLQKIAKALGSYAADHNNKIPQTTLTETISVVAPTLAEAEKAEIISITPSPNIIEKILVPDYLTSLPKDPSTPKYYYSYISNGYHFRIYAVYEASTDRNCTEKFGSHCFMSVSQ